MLRRSVRITCLVAGVLATVGLCYRAFLNESSLSAARQDADTAERMASETAELLFDLRASLHAYVAPGQGLPFWGKRAQESIGALKEKLESLDARVARSGGSMQEALDGVDQIVAAEKRARTYVSRDEMQLAGDVIFTEIRDVLAAVTNQVQSVRTNVRVDHDRRTASIRSEQMMLAGAAIALWMLIAVLLLPAELKPEIKDPGQWRNELNEKLKKPAPTPPVLVTPVVPPSNPIAAVIEVASVKKTSEICADLSALADPGALQGVLERVSTLLNATGLIVWVASNDAASLSPVATHGFDPKIVTRIGKVPRDSANLTAAAFRDNAPRMSAATETTPAALAVPMCGPTGPSGVLSVEMRAGQAVEESKVALASIVAAQLATLAMPIQDIEPVAVIEQQRAAI